MEAKETVWKTPYGEVRIVEREDGTVEVNGSSVEPVSKTIENLWDEKPDEHVGS